MTPIEMKKITSLLLIAASLTACTNLEEQVLDETFQTNVAEKDIAPGLIAPVYALLPTIYQHTTYFALQQITTDEAILPYRGGTDWGDNGIYLELHRHTYNIHTIRPIWFLGHPFGCPSVKKGYFYMHVCAQEKESKWYRQCADH